MNPLGGPPPAPRPQDMQPSPAPNALAGGQGAQGPQGQGGQRLPAPSHGQTVAALRHFGAIAQEMRALLSDPSVGRSNMKGKIIDAVTKLVTNRIISAPQAVEQLGTVPEPPFQQKQWLTNHYQQSVQAAGQILDHHTNAFHGVPEHAIDKSAGADDHMETMDSLTGHYRRG